MTTADVAPIAYVTKDQAETSVLFELISARYERRSLLINADQALGAWNTIFPEIRLLVAAVPNEASAVLDRSCSPSPRSSTLQRQNRLPKSGFGKPVAEAQIEPKDDA